MTLGALAIGACRQVPGAPSHVPPSGVSPSAAHTAAAPSAPLNDRDSALCKERPRCALTRHRPVMESPDRLVIVDLRIAHEPSATTDEDRCDRREYWLLGPGREILLANDCESQWGADNPGPATTSLDGTRFRVSYVEFQSSDGCETVDATVRLSPLAIEKEVRRQGTVRRNQCSAQKPVRTPLTPGDGSIGRPLLALHQ
jgi:hypothetical protein